jgi:hypothetical protein
MRETIGLRARHWLILMAALLYGVVRAGWLDLHGIAVSLASRPDVTLTFSDADLGRADALILVFSILFLGPLALLAGAAVLFSVLAVFGGLLVPIIRWFRLPEWVASALVLGAVTASLWIRSEAWLPRSLWFVELMARACRVVISA